MQRSLNLKNPMLLSEKIQWLKLYDNNPKKAVLTDKLNAKKYIEKYLPELKVAKLYQECGSFDKIDFDKLPKIFILKTNHACRTNYPILDKDIFLKKTLKDTKNSSKTALSINFAYWSELELQYRDIEPKIYAEEYLYSENESYNPNYEIWCFNGKPEFVHVLAKEGDHFTQSCYSPEWNKLPFDLFLLANDEVPKPDNLDKMLKYARFLANGFAFVRVDFYEANNELYFGEMTFTPNSGYIKFIPEKYDLIYGEKLNLPINKSDFG